MTKCFVFNLKAKAETYAAVSRKQQKLPKLTGNSRSVGNTIAHRPRRFYHMAWKQQMHSDGQDRLGLLAPCSKSPTYPPWPKCYSCRPTGASGLRDALSSRRRSRDRQDRCTGTTARPTYICSGLRQHPAGPFSGLCLWPFQILRI